MSVLHRKFFNDLAGEWDGLVEDNPNLQKYMKQFGVNGGDRVLDVGAGTGRMSVVLAEMVGPQGLVAAVDLAEKMLSIGKRKRTSDNIRYICADACSLPLANCCFDKIVCFSTFPHILHKQMALREFSRVLKSGGKCLIFHTSSHEKLNAYHASLNGIVRHDRLPRAETLSTWLRRLNFSVSYIEDSDLFWVEASKR